ncbi:MAG: hypothetical protein HKL99_07765 [Burkholderiales bacterium]|jgi:hypothetical protein|nr:hypothetical protein [Burkholderiales bacterium]
MAVELLGVFEKNNKKAGVAQDFCREESRHVNGCSPVECSFSGCTEPGSNALRLNIRHRFHAKPAASLRHAPATQRH